MIDQDATLDEIRQAGVDALLRALGPVGMVRFLQQYTRGMFSNPGLLMYAMS